MIGKIAQFCKNFLDWFKSDRCFVKYFIDAFSYTNSNFLLLTLVILFVFGMDKVMTQLANGKRTFVLNWPEWIFWSFVPIGAGCMILHFIENCLDVLKGNHEKEESDK